ncbi:MAG TPA: nucleotidyl transferase AbiEii/AbiGii toxin family protein [Candidatus Limnocylindria bacterium]|jgi:hypothetical protein|nr:nucleotidyl transferase AbiEii/AbiGii toxin family protein [Candidatus Limnocylindria bacterium]
MPIGEFEREVLRCLATNRNPESFIAGATVLNQGADSPRSSEDIDVFHDSNQSLKAAVESDLEALERDGFRYEVILRDESFVRAIVQRAAATTKVEWARDSAFRFFPVEADLELGWRLNFWDAATNKVHAVAGRTKARDYIDILHLHLHHLAFGALVWAAAGQDPGLTPEMLVEFAVRNSKYRPEHFDQVRLTVPVDLQRMKEVFLAAVEDAQDLFAKLPSEEIGCFYLNETGHPVYPDPDSPGFGKLKRHFGSVRGTLPRISEE